MYRMVVFVSSTFLIRGAAVFIYYSCNKMTKTRFKFNAKIKFNKTLDLLISRSKTKWCKHQKKLQRNYFNFTIADLSNFKKR